MVKKSRAELAEEFRRASTAKPPGWDKLGREVQDALLVDHFGGPITPALLAKAKKKGGRRAKKVTAATLVALAALGLLAGAAAGRRVMKSKPAKKRKSKDRFSLWND